MPAFRRRSRGSRARLACTRSGVSVKAGSAGNAAPNRPRDIAVESVLAALRLDTSGPSHQFLTPTVTMIQFVAGGLRLDTAQVDSLPWDSPRNS